MSNSSTTIHRSAALSLALFLCAGMLAHAATWYVRTTGSDANNGQTAGTAFATIQKAINEAANGDVIDVGAGTFAPTTTITVNKEVTIDGAGEGTTIIDVGGFNAWGIYITANNVTIKDLTVEGDATVNQQFTVKIGTGGPASGTNTVAEDFSLENVTITNVRRTGLDLNGVDGATITNVTVSNVTNGFGMSISSSHNVTVNGLTTSNCAWGDVGVFPANTPYQWNTTLDGPDNIVFTGTLSLGAGSISVQDGALSNARGTWVGTISNNAADNANVTVPASFSHVVNANRSGGLVLHNVGTESTIKTLAATLAAATTPFTFSNITINDLDNDEWDVVPGLSIQTAVNAATSGDVVNVQAGTYVEGLTINKSLTLRGPNASESPNTGARVAEAILKPAGGSTGPDGITGTAANITVVVEGFTIDMVDTRWDAGYPEDDSKKYFQQTSKANTTWTFEHNIFQNTGFADNGHWLFNGSNPGLVFNLWDNLFQNTATIRNGYSNGISIWDTNPATIDIRDNVWNSTGYTAMNLNNCHGTITNNTFVENRDLSAFDPDNDWFVYQSGILLANPNFDLDITNNSFQNVGLGVVFYGNADGVINVTGNTFAGTTIASIRLSSGQYDPATNLNDVTISDNAFLNYAGTSYIVTAKELSSSRLDGQVVTATCNYFDTDDYTSVLDRTTLGAFTVAPYRLGSVTGDCLGGPVKVYASETETTPVSAHGTIQSAIDAATTLNGYVVRVDAGTYAEALTINKKLSIIGSGSGTVIQKTGGTAVTYTAAGSGTSTTDRAQLRDVTISVSTKGILAAAVVSHLAIDNVTIENNTSYGIHINNTSGTMTDWVITNSTFDGNSSAMYISTAANIDGLSVTGCTIENSTSSAIYVGQSSEAPGGVSNATFSNNTFTSNGPSNNQAGMYIEKLTNSTISGNTFTNNGTSTNPRGIIINLKYGSYENVTISNNTLTENRGGTVTSGYGINVQGRNDASSYNTNPGSLDNLSITGNTVEGFLNGIEVDNAVDWNTTTISNNSIANCTNGILGVIYGTGNTANATTEMDVNNNSITGATLAVVNYNPNGGTMNATCNWFGSADATVVGGKISGAITAIPYLTSVDPADYTSPGFTPSGACNGTGPVSSDDPVGQYFTIQSAIDGSNAGATVTASAGTYAEAVALNKGVTVTGTGATITGLVTISNENAVLTDMTLAGTPIALTFTTDIDSYTLGSGNTFDAACTTFVETVAGNNITLPAGTDLGGLTDNYLIEDKINHALDAGGLGIVRWNGNNLYVTSNSGSIQRAIDAATSSDAVNIDAVTFNENPVLHKNIVLNSLTSTARRLGTNNYFVFGTTSLGPSNLSGFNTGDLNKIGVNTNGTVSEAITAVNTSGTVLLTTEVQSSGTAEAEFDAVTFTNKNITIEGNGTTGSNCDVQPVISINGENSVALTSEGDANRTLKNVTLMINASTGANFVRVTNGSIGDITVEDVRFQRGGQDITGLQPLTTPSALADGKDIPEFLQDGADVGFGPGKVLFGQGAPFGASNVVAAWKGSDANSNSVQTVYSYSTTSLNLSQTFLTRRPSRSVNDSSFNGNTVIGIPTSGDRMLQAIASSDVIAGDEKTVFVVFRTPSASNTDRVIYKHGDHLSGISIIYNDTENVQFNIFNNRTSNVGTFETFETAVAPNTVAIAQLYFDGTSTTNRVGAALDWGSSDHWEIFADDDDFSATSLSAPTLNLTSAINVGALSQGKTYFEGAAQTRSTPGFTLKDGFIAEVIVLNTADASIRNDVYCYLHRKYDLGNNNNGLERAIPVYDYEEEVLAGQSNVVWPNPATDLASVAFTVPEAQFVTITLVDALGRPVANIASEYMMAGEQIYDITLDTIPSGLYTVAINGFTFNTSAPVMVRK